MEFIPAIDLIEGQCVRLVQGDFDRQISYGDPLLASMEIESEGARWLHLVDLDAARSRSGPNRAVIKNICRSVTMKVEVGGGVRTLQDATELFEVGVSRVIIGTMAIENPILVEQVAKINSEGVAVGLDYRRVGQRREVALKGWLEGSGRDLFDVLPSLVELGASAVVATDISRDGTFGGPDLETLDQLLTLASGSAQIIASGGISSLSDIADLNALKQGDIGLFGAISGRAIHDGRISVKDAVEICRA